MFDLNLGDLEVSPGDLVRWCLLKKNFEKLFHKQPGYQVHEEDGVRYERRFSKERSNSGKTWRWLMDFHITHADGRLETLPDPQGRNRRNDPGRNYGLGRE